MAVCLERIITRQGKAADHLLLGDISIQVSVSQYSRVRSLAHHNEVIVYLLRLSTLNNQRTYTRIKGEKD
ncbi:hypothetical protein E2C01_041535 [Portunus trituberculatus]|uniref:Uncharacterized protein n=1 Tax=Portunus trituberculatus TaxID=210409 RepID=A0A5B7FS54_PORTR|nr:hypothetical protein [Portunus trituberculatus]